MDRTCSKYGVEQRCVRGSGEVTRGTETNWKT